MKTWSLLYSLILSIVMVATAEASTLIQNKGSDTLVNVAQAWAEAYQQVAPEVAVAVSGGGSGTGIAALLNGTVDLANTSRVMDSKELELAHSKGIQPIEHIVGFDALAIYVHQKNPLASISLQQLRSIYGRDGDVNTWTDLGVEVPGCQKQKIIRVSRQNNSGTYLYFREAVLGAKGRYKMGSLDMQGSKDVVDLVEKTPCAIGYSGMAYATANVKVACVTKAEGEACAFPTEETALSGAYPIARPLFMYTNGEPSGVIKAYLDWILSDAGQCIITQIGYSPIRSVHCE